VVERRQNDAVTLKNGIILASYPCRPEAVRGLRACCVVLDEVAFYRNSENQPIDREMLRAVRPCLATTAGRLVILSSPYGQSGILWDLHRQHFGSDDSLILIWQATAPEMNPTLRSDYLQRMAEDDPEAYRSEVLGEFRAGIATFLDPEAIEACIETGVRERPCVDGVSYVAGFDASGGRHDRSVLAIAHVVDGVATLDLLRVWNAPHSPAHAIAEACAVLRTFHITKIVGDRYAAEFVASTFCEHGITYEPSDRDRSALYLELLPLVNAARVRLLDDPELLRELRGLERRRGATRDRIDHRPNAYDDRATACATALVQAAIGVSVGPIDRWIFAANAAAPPTGVTALGSAAFGDGSSGGVAGLERAAFGGFGGGAGAYSLGRHAFGHDD
jgi:hypothetical protein